MLADPILRQQAIEKRVEPVGLRVRRWAGREANRQRPAAAVVDHGLVVRERHDVHAMVVHCTDDGAVVTNLSGGRDISVSPL